MNTIHPAYDIEKRVWFTDCGKEARSLAELEVKLPGKRIVGYHKGRYKVAEKDWLDWLGKPVDRRRVAIYASAKTISDTRWRRAKEQKMAINTKHLQQEPQQQLTIDSKPISPPSTVHTSEGKQKRWSKNLLPGCSKHSWGSKECDVELLHLVESHSYGQLAFYFNVKSRNVIAGRVMRIRDEQQGIKRSKRCDGK